MLEQTLWTACITPFLPGGNQVDYHSLEACLRLQTNAGNGIVLLGSTGEGLSLTDTERRDIVSFACQLNLTTQLLIGMPNHNFSAAQAWLEFCQDLPIQGHLMTTPIYTKPGISGQTQWFEKLLDQAKHPAMLYNIPGRAGINLHPATIKNLQQHDRFVAIKDSSGKVDSLLAYKIAAPDIAVYCGDDHMLPAMAAEGSVGLVSIAANAWPIATKNYVHHSLQSIKSRTKLWWEACHALHTASNPIPIKALMKDLGIISHDTVRLPLSLADLPSRQTLLNYHTIIHHWRPEND